MNSELQDDTRERLLSTAGALFADKGFQSTTVREICQQAKANVAAVNYYFSDKQGLYLAAVQQAHCANPELFLADFPEDLTPIERFREFIHRWLTEMLDETRPGWHTQLMLRELADPTDACRQLVEAYIRPMADKLRDILKSLLPEDFPDERGWLIGFSIVGQCLFYRLQRPIIALLIGPEALAQLTVPVLEQHVVSLTLAALGLGPPVTASPHPLLPPLPGWLQSAGDAP